MPFYHKWSSEFHFSSAFVNYLNNDSIGNWYKILLYLYKVLYIPYLSFFPFFFLHLIIVLLCSLIYIFIIFYIYFVLYNDVNNTCLIRFLKFFLFLNIAIAIICSYYILFIIFFLYSVKSIESYLISVPIFLFIFTSFIVYN